MNTVEPHHLLSHMKHILLVTLGENFTFIHLVEIDGMEEHIHQGYSFVDDTTTGDTDDDPELEPTPTDQVELTTSKEALIAKMEEIIQLFLDLLQATGRDLAPEKCMWNLISQRWKEDKPILL
jgi:hypothetical protein